MAVSLVYVDFIILHLLCANGISESVLDIL